MYSRIITMLLPTVVAVSLLLVSGGGVTADAGYRLPLEVEPVAYDVSLVPYLDNEGNRSFTFDGIVSINVTAKKESSNITLHYADMTINSITVSGLTVEKHTLESKRNFLTITLNDTLVEGKNHTITINYRGNINSGRSGFYRSSYKTPEGETRWLGTTQFEATDARRAFPCFDEPALKATFVIHIAPPIGYHAASNMPVDSIKGPEGEPQSLQSLLTLRGLLQPAETDSRFWYTFEKSVAMSSYLVAFVVSDFSFLEHGPFRILGRPHAIDTARYSLSVSPLILSTIANLTGVDYTLPKMDQVAVPDFSAGAMENWGLVTYRQAYLLFDEDTQTNRKRAATVIAHEFGHQWFGNLVSPDWWTYTWLNEAFATFFEYFATDKVEPQWNLLHTMVTSMQHSIMTSDSIPLLSHPITRYVETPAEISSSFDSITYSKGGSLVKMVYHFLTEPTFYKGLNIYLNKRAYGKATPDDLFDAWQAAAVTDGVLPKNLTVTDILDTWTLQAGYPVLTVRRNYQAGTATITQKRFVTIGSASSERWWVPISYTTRTQRNFNKTAPTVWLSPKENSSVTLQGIAPEDWLVLNIQDAAFYRINYDDKNWQLLQEALNKEQYDGIHLLNRAQILNDAKVLGVAKRIRPTISLEIMSGLRNEPEPVVWTTILRQLSQLYQSLANSEYLSELKAVFAPVVENMSRSRSHNLVAIDLEEVKDWASALSDSYVESLRRVQDVETVLDSPAEWCGVVRTDANAWDSAWRRYKNASSVSERRDALAALGCAKNAERLLNAALADVAEDEGVLEQDRAAALAAPCGSETRRAVGGGGVVACTQAVAFVAMNTGRIQQQLEDPEEYLGLVRRLASRVRTEEQFDMLRYAATAVRIGQPPVLTTEVWTELLQLARSRVDWSRGDGAPIVSWLQQQAAEQTKS